MPDHPAELDLHLRLDRATPVPLHYQLRQALRAALDDGRLPPGATLPPEPALAHALGVSRHTVRQAVDELVRAGRLLRLRGRGTFVAEPAVAQDLGRFYSFAQEFARQGLQPSTRVLRVKRHPAAADIAAALGLAPGVRVVELVRLRLLDGEPVIHETNLLPEVHVPGLTRADAASGSLYDLLERRFGLRPTHAEETVRAVVLDAVTASVLGVTAGEAGFAVERLTVAGETPIELRRSRIRADRYHFRVHLPSAQLGHD